MGGEGNACCGFVTPVVTMLPRRLPRRTTAMKEVDPKGGVVTYSSYGRKSDQGPSPSMPVVRRECNLRGLIVRPVAALRRRQPAALRRDRPALHAVRRRYLHLDLALAIQLPVAGGSGGVELLVGHLVHLCRAHVLPHQRDL